MQWSVQVNKVDAGGVNIEPAFRAAIYENLVDELAKTSVTIFTAQHLFELLRAR